MPRLTVRFLDDEVVEGEAQELDLDAPDFHIRIEDAASNNRGAWVPLAAVKRMSLGTGPADEHAAEAQEMVALRFADGEVLRGYLNGSLRHHRHGLTLTLYSPDRRTMDVVGVPYGSLKALWFLRSWDSRPPGFRAEGLRQPPLVQLLGDLREAGRLLRAGRIDRQEYLNRRRRLLDEV